MYNITQYPLLPWSLVIRPTHPAFRVTQPCLHTSGTDEFTWKESIIYLFITRFISHVKSFTKWRIASAQHTLIHTLIRAVQY